MDTNQPVAAVRGFVQRYRRGFMIAAVGAVPVILGAYAVGGAFYGGRGVSALQTVQLTSAIVAIVFGFALGCCVALFFTKYRDIAAAVVALVLVFVTMLPGFGFASTPTLGGLAFFVGISVVLALLASRLLPEKPRTFGSAEWASPADVNAAGLFGGKGFFLGEFEIAPEQPREAPRHEKLHYAGDRHLLTVAPTRAGKGICAIVPNLLTYKGSALVIDPKGENALITGKARHDMGHHVMLLDPWDLAASRMGTEPSRFNPMDWLQPDDPDLAENAMLLADALVVPTPGGKDKFWDEEAKALLVGLILHVATDEEEADHRNLGRVRDLLMLNKEGLTNLFDHMALSEQPIVAGTGSRSAVKSEEVLANVMASAQAQTHFLDSPRIRESLSASDFAFEHLKSEQLTIYLILPADRLSTFGRWLRLLIQQAITVNARNIDQKPERPVLFMLDEMPALGHLTMIEQAYGLMAGFGIQLWGIVQDLSQLKKIYGDSWETFVSNSGVLQYFGSRDQMTAEYFSKLCGVTTVLTLSEAIAKAVTSAAGGGSNTSTSTTTTAQAQRSLAFPDELMTFRRDQQLLLVENANPISAQKRAWFTDPALQERGIDLSKLS